MKKILELILIAKNCDKASRNRKMLIYNFWAKVPGDLIKPTELSAQSTNSSVDGLRSDSFL